MTICRCSSLVVVLAAVVHSSYDGAAETPVGVSVDRHLGLLEDWDLSFATDTPMGDNGVALQFNHGSGGSPRYRIYGSSSFKDPMMDPLIGQTCRSKGGVEQESPTGMTISETVDDAIFVVGIVTDPTTLDDIFIYKETDGSRQAVIQFCVYVSLVNEATGEEANFVETEIRFKIDQDSQISLEHFSSNVADPVTRGFATTFGLTANICKAPDKGQGDTVSVCISAADSIVPLAFVETFLFEATDADGNHITQSAFDGGIASSLTEVEVNDGTTFKFNTILKADFFRYSDSPTTVTGFGACSMNYERRALQDGMPQMSGDGEADVPVRLSFQIGGATQGQVQRDRSGSVLTSTSSSAVTSETRESVSTALLYMSMAVSLMASLLSLLAIWLSVRGPREGGGKISTIETKVTERSDFDDVSLTNATWV